MFKVTNKDSGTSSSDFTEVPLLFTLNTFNTVFSILLYRFTVDFDKAFVKFLRNIPVTEPLC